MNVRDILLAAGANRVLGGADLTGQLPETLMPPGGLRFYAEDDSEVAADPLAWFALLRDEGRRAVRIAIGPAVPLSGIDMPARQLAQFVNGGPEWRLEAIGDRSCAIWRTADAYVEDGPHGPAWIAYGARVAGHGAPSDAWPDLTSATAALDAALDPMIALAAAEGMTDPFGTLFQEAKALLAGRTQDWPRQGYFLEFEAFAGFDPPRLRIAAAIARAWVFGGMGSWNDVGPDGPAVDGLYEALVRASAALANSTAPEPLAAS